MRQDAFKAALCSCNLLLFTNVSNECVSNSVQIPYLALLIKTQFTW